MNSSGRWGMALHQAISFFSPMISVPKTTAVFWPGFALQNQDPALLKKTLVILARTEPGIRLAAGCCGQPAFFLFPEKYPAYREKLEHRLNQSGVQRIYTACPNCTRQLCGIRGIQVIPIWSVLAGTMTREDICGPGAAAPAGGAKTAGFIWHDPCPTRNDPAEQQAVRGLLRLSGVPVLEPEHTGPKTLCCGNFHMMHTLEPEKSARMRARRLEEFPADRIILSSCQGCLGSFQGQGRETLHLLELLFGKSRSQGWKNRILVTLCPGIVLRSR